MVVVIRLTCETGLALYILLLLVRRWYYFCSNRTLSVIWISLFSPLLPSQAHPFRSFAMILFMQNFSFSYPKSIESIQLHSVYQFSILILSFFSHPTTPSSNTAHLYRYQSASHSFRPTCKLMLPYFSTNNFPSLPEHTVSIFLVTPRSELTSSSDTLIILLLLLLSYCFFSLHTTT